MTDFEELKRRLREHDDERLYHEADVLMTEAADAIEQLQREVHHWKSNHDSQVAKAALLAQRPDLPVDRIPAYKEMERLQRELEEARKDAERMDWMEAQCLDAHGPKGQGGARVIGADTGRWCRAETLRDAIDAARQQTG